MKTISPLRLLKSPLRSFLSLALVWATLVPIALLTAAEADKQTETRAEQRSDSDSSRPKAKVPAKKLSGAELYSMHCNRCHPERYPTERTAAQWKTILIHMRVRANLPAEQSRTILKYLQDNSGR